MRKMASPRSSSSSFFSPANSNPNLSTGAGLSIAPSPTIVVGSEHNLETTRKRLASLPAIKRANLVAEFTALKHSPPPGIIVSLPPSPHSPDYPTLWSGVLFVRKGPYATAILRFQISFPDDYPDSAPLVTFSTDIFHPLISPLTTYVGEESGKKGGVRLPPGGFGLGHGFPGWFKSDDDGEQQQHQEMGGAFVVGGSGIKKGASGGAKKVSTWEVLRYIKSTFDDEGVLDEVPLEAAGNPGAWHAWRTHRRCQREREQREREREEQKKREQGAAGVGDEVVVEKAETVVSDDGRGSVGGGGDARTSSGSLVSQVPATPTSSGRRPEEWNWEGVWERRVKKGIAASLSEGVLFGGAAGGPDEVINFLPMDEAEVEGVKQNLLRTLGAVV
ncbi:hypothetical protein QBC40DRAFT_232582 [Triangularia verruculosa]|uniref:UBC core domain-containing protein n=1 Tax=Triangularia verruculosa TaxID=2587418 RepID=A0AAN7ASS1_9PEZI|nr:hypothetical protein QBC40DRAFT_232582 [Triangularia verruculosa]